MPPPDRRRAKPRSAGLPKAAARPGTAARPERDAPRGGLAAAPVARALTRWFARHRRDLPWRRDRDPYRIWVSETMLQQTTVKVVVPYFERFVKQFPSLARLAAAPLEDVLAAWSGLGYYRRARHLHEAARRLIDAGGPVSDRGRIPDDRAALLGLPGIGRYTAGAILSIAFGRREPIVDGNVTRVLARLLGERRDPSRGEASRRLWEQARLLVEAAASPGDLNEALMELGATVCTPATPSCRACPLEDACAARAAGDQESIPAPRPRPAPRAVTRTVALVGRGGRLLVRRRPDTGLMDGLWELPEVEADDGGGHRLAGGGPALEKVEPAGTARHSITWRRLTVRVVRARLRGRAPRGGTHRWVTPREALRLPSSSLLAKTLAAAGVDPSRDARRGRDARRERDVRRGRDV